MNSSNILTLFSAVKTSCPTETDAKASQTPPHYSQNSKSNTTFNYEDIEANSENQPPNMVQKIARILFTSESTELDQSPPQILKIEPQLTIIPKPWQLTVICEENTQSFSENASDILSPDIQVNPQILHSHHNQSSPAPRTSQFLSGNCTPSSPRQENFNSPQSLFTPAGEYNGNRIDFKDEDGLNSPDVIHHRNDTTIKKESSMKALFMG